MPIVVSYNNLAALGSLALQAGQAEGSLMEKQDFAQRRARDEALGAQWAMSGGGTMPAAQFGHAPPSAGQPGGAAATAIDFASRNRDARILASQSPQDGTQGIPQRAAQEFAKTLAREQAKTQAARDATKGRLSELQDLVTSGAISNDRASALYDAFLNERFGFSPAKTAVAGQAKPPTNSQAAVGYAIAQTRQWDQLDQVEREIESTALRSTKSPTGRISQVIAGVQNYFEQLSDREFMGLWAQGDYPESLEDFMQREYERRVGSGSIQETQVGPARSNLSDPSAMSDQELLQEAYQLLQRRGGQ